MSIAAVWLIVVVRTIPRPIDGAVGDYGFFTGVADRLRAGDVLYEQVWDNKDPLYFYSLALAREAGAWGSWFLEIAWIIIAAAAAYWMTQRLDRISRVAALLCAAATTPLILIGMAYFMGSTHVPGVALALLSVASAFSRKWLLAGIFLATLGILKLVLLPVALAAVAVMLIRDRHAGPWLRFISGFGATAVALATVLGLRGELGGFLVTQVDNVRHAQAPIVSAEQSTLFYKIAQHLVILINPHVLGIIVTTAVILALTGWVNFRRTSGSTAERDLWGMTVGAFLAAIMVIAITGKWFHHAQTLEISSVPALLLLASAFSRLRSRTAVVTLPVMVLTTYLLMGSPPLQPYVDSGRTAGQMWAAAQDTDPLTLLLEERSPGSVAFVGFGNLVPRSGGLEDWTLVCRHIGQRPFHPTWMFDETLDCLPQADLVVVTNDYGPDPAFPAYTDFTESVEALLNDQYTCDEVDGFRLCIRN